MMLYIAAIIGAEGDELAVEIVVEKLGFASRSYHSYMTVVEVDTEVSRVAESDSDVCFLSHLKNTSHWQVSYLGEESQNVHNVFKGEKNFLSSPNVIVL